METLWAPWRMEYIKAVDKKVEGCIFCSKPCENNDRENLIVYRGKKNFVILNKFPYNNGHCMVVPYVHTSNPAELDLETSTELWQIMNRCKEFLTASMHPEGFNIGMNIGRVAGAGIDQHIHLHIVPRWNGDTNFMPVTGETKVISQAILETQEMLASYFSTIG